MTNSYEIIRWIYTNASAVLGVFGNNDKPTENVYLTKQDYLIAVFIKELINHSPLMGSEKPCGFLTITKQLYGEEASEILYEQVFQNKSQPIVIEKNSKEALDTVVSWLACQVNKGNFSFIFNFSKDLAANPLVVAVMEAAFAEAKKSPFTLYSKIRKLENQWLGNEGFIGTEKIREIKFLLKAVLRDLYPTCITTDSEYFDGSKVPFVVQALCVWWLMREPEERYQSNQDQILREFKRLWHCLWVTSFQNESDQIALAAQYVYDQRARSLFVEEEMRPLAQNLDIFDAGLRNKFNNGSLLNMNLLSAQVRLYISRDNSC